MSEWWTYRPEDFLLFSPRVYWRLFELQNAQYWPLHLLALALGGLILVLAFRQSHGQDRWIWLLFAALWMFIGWSFLWQLYATINWAIAYVAPVFAVQALLLIVAASGKVTFDRQDIAGRAGLLLATFGLVFYPLLPALFGRPWTNAEVFGIAPDPTAIATLGFLLAASGRMVLLLFPVPLIWLLLSGVTLDTMGDRQSSIPLLAAGTTVALLCFRLVNRWRT
jgi:multidrug transporter EmrE-like cation transporter